MTEPASVFVASISELVDTFRGAILALIPFAERAQLVWKDLNTHDDWEELTRCLYRVFVANSTLLDASAPVEPMPLAPYDYNLLDYAEYSWIEFSVPGSVENYALLRLLTSDEPFDTLHLAQVDLSTGALGDDIRIPWANTGFLLRRRFVDGTSAVVEEVRVDW